VSDYTYEGGTRSAQKQKDGKNKQGVIGRISVDWRVRGGELTFESGDRGCHGTGGTRWSQIGKNRY